MWSVSYTNLEINFKMGDFKYLPTLEPPNGKSLKLRYPSFGHFISSSKLNELEKDKF